MQRHPDRTPRPRRRMLSVPIAEQVSKYRIVLATPAAWLSHRDLHLSISQGAETRNAAEIINHKEKTTPILTLRGSTLSSRRAVSIIIP